MRPAQPMPWREALMEALGLGLFMVVAGVCGTVLEFPGSPIHRALPNAVLRRSIMGVVIGLAAVGLAHSPWGRRSGAHLNPAMTWTFFRLGRVRGPVALLYTLAQFSGGLVGCLFVAAVAGHAFLAPPVEGIATVPRSPAVAFVAELAISGLLMLVVLHTSRLPTTSRYTAWMVGVLLFLYITLEAPVSGMSMNPARTFASALPSGRWQGIWVYFTAPLGGMLLAAEIFLRTSSTHEGCAKVVHHIERRPCVFCGRTDHVRAPQFRTG